ncbi:UDP-4-amino-4,6-dideoxy-N-acetyl-beta-L-altrosamine transaminase [Tenacibaculum discolor]|uniref:UDP-4-amino-4, 6-dideoxy-N-acetyl-beta-L-altrosamine transaminase n=1 Tax=Tenacibaculum discolor TaxID=361581 RepID=A0A2G1BXP3_9FLAO|nr:UDP-4-amino-4,6-dideoxy-N-acetyl-beta-L-altrosamine transaminase [Tenacibaculum discolor]MDP2541099.1 UDP-4-amino-4,6-dideoxy-N-acetyl-beta-L-altrosamine transaminase [Tenacibaculum discolor]PHN98812.1 UDP-4-amino-4,6-dideoxy-N-acetyl-beta-L-altrosamine transaminase [Tenacibaculum discolor]PHO01634.1 UDP-4-amino-4,6-dideoxy-N-acetyl-beta-L-altrosamine transaminase [Rhodobacteraceae bacterium 4F10]
MKSIPYGRQDINQDDVEAVISTLQSDFLTQGPKVKEFEDKFAQYVGAKYALAVNNATSGLHLSVLAMNLKKGDRVITTPITFAASANCVRYAQGEVWFADIDPDTYLLSLESTRKLIESKPKGFFKGIIPVDFAGLPVNLEEFRKLANENDLWIIEDACHAPGGYFTDSKNKKQYCGNGYYADIGVFSFHPVKHIACGEGGMLTTNSEEIYKKLALLRTHGITKENLSENHGGWFYEMQELGFNYRLTDFQSALGITQLAKNDFGVIRRNEISKTYKNAFQGKIKFQCLPKGSYNAHHLFVIEVDDRKELYDFLKSHNIFAQIHYIPVHTLPYYKNIGYSEAELTNAENYYSKCISLPMFPSLTNEELQYVIDKVLEFIND